jgi:hypothetical protein
MLTVPQIPLRRVDDLLMRIEDLTTEARRRGYGTLAYFLDTARIEAQLQQEREAQGRRERDADPSHLWRPEV